MSEKDRNKVKQFIEEFGFADKELNARFAFREVREEEADEVAKIEQICFPPNEACSAVHMQERVLAAPELFLVAVDRKTGKIAGFLNGLATEEYSFRDEFFEDAGLHNPNGKNIMLLGLDVLPAYRRQGLAKEIVYQYLRREWKKNRKMIILTCAKSKIKMYEKMGFCNMGIADSNWGGEEWYEMSYVINS
ncbi:GNAT family N-acetyltransferase [Novisyntrophococcus fermenticellae]|uniref:GNAT family N-acetyltransferase n=1 Tax=Novisyntrophococcus fermenticellae TaxID=2068655 RepID=UPI001E4C3BF2|nr:GNAT family N-acetyltransferase [Novisyntrophococcus fermenticellae]